LNGLYVEPYFVKGIKGFKIYHDSDYFKEKQYFNKDGAIADTWINAVKNEANFFDITRKYEKL
jgi:hypothetical protein